MAFVTVPMDAFPGRTLSIGLFTNIKNAPELRQRIIKEAPAYALVNAQLVLDLLQVWWWLYRYFRLVLDLLQVNPSNCKRDSQHLDFSYCTLVRHTHEKSCLTLLFIGPR